MARVNPQYIVADMVDTQVFMRLSERFSVNHVPLTIINGAEHLSGLVDETRLLAGIKKSIRES